LWHAHDGTFLNGLNWEDVDVSAIECSKEFLIVGFSDGKIRLLDFGDLSVVREIAAHRGRVNDLCRIDERQFASVSSDLRTRIWDLTTFELVADFGGHEERINCVAWSAGTQTLCTGDDIGLVQLTPIGADAGPTSKRIRLDHSINAIAVCADTDELLVADGRFLRVYGLERTTVVLLWLQTTRAMLA
jgi:WD40 repeat protein